MQQALRQNQIVDILRASKSPTTAACLAEQTQVTLRTIYRDIASMVASDIPISGSPGIGYHLQAGYDLPPLMFSVEELEALLLGAEMVKQRGDDQLVQAAVRAVAKIAAVVPTRLKAITESLPLRVVPVPILAPDKIDLAEVRIALRDERKVRLRYLDQGGSASERVVWPIVLGYFEQKRILVGWCETRSDFRHFRTDRIQDVLVLAERLPKARQLLEASWRQEKGVLRDAIKREDEVIS